MSNSDRHNNYPLPNILVGGGAGALKMGGHRPSSTTLTNLHLTVLNKVGLELRASRIAPAKSPGSTHAWRTVEPLKARSARSPVVAAGARSRAFAADGPVVTKVADRRPALERGRQRACARHGRRRRARRQRRGRRDALLAALGAARRRAVAPVQHALASR
jgi:hypothetical protein